MATKRKPTKPVKAERQPILKRFSVHHRWAVIDKITGKLHWITEWRQRARDLAIYRHRIARVEIREVGR